MEAWKVLTIGGGEFSLDETVVRVVTLPRPFHDHETLHSYRRRRCRRHQGGQTDEDHPIARPRARARRNRGRRRGRRRDGCRSPAGDDAHALEHDERRGDRDVQVGARRRTRRRTRTSRSTSSRSRSTSATRSSRRPSRPARARTSCARRSPTSPAGPASASSRTSRPRSRPPTSVTSCRPRGRTTTTRGKIWGLPQAPDALTIFYNKALFKSAGIKNTQLPTTLPALQSFCQKFPTGKGIFLRADSYWVQPWVWGYGGGLIVPASKQILIGNTKSTAGMQAYKDAVLVQVRVPEQGLLERLRQRPDGLQERQGRDDRQRPLVDGGHPAGPVVQVLVQPRRPRDPEGPGRPGLAGRRQRLRDRARARRTSTLPTS